MRFYTHIYQHNVPGRNVFDGFVPSNPEGKRLDFGSPDFLQLEGAGMAAVAGAAFVLVAGGLGERLGYKGEFVCVCLCLCLCVGAVCDVAEWLRREVCGGLECSSVAENHASLVHETVLHAPRRPCDPAGLLVDLLTAFDNTCCCHSLCLP